MGRDACRCVEQGREGVSTESMGASGWWGRVVV